MTTSSAARRRAERKSHTAVNFIGARGRAAEGKVAADVTAGPTISETAAATARRGVGGRYRVLGKLAHPQARSDVDAEKYRSR